MRKWIAGSVGLREEVNQVASDRIDAIGGNHVAGKCRPNKTARPRGIGAAGERIVNGDELARLVSRAREVTLPFEHGRHTSGADHSLYPAHALIRNEEERSILAVVQMWDHNGATGAAAELVEPERRLGLPTKIHKEIRSA